MIVKFKKAFHYFLKTVGLHPKFVQQNLLEQEIDVQENYLNELTRIEKELKELKDNTPLNN